MRSFFYVTHDQEVAMTLSDRMAVLNEGRVEQVGPPEEIYREPASPFVADFIGDTNLVNGTIDGGEVHVGGNDGFSFAVDADAAGDVTVSIRPEDIDVVESDWDFAGEVIDRYFQGDQTQYVVDPATDGVTEMTVVMQGRRTPIETGETGHFRVQADAPVVFDE